MTYVVATIGKIGDALANPLAWLVGAVLALLGYLIGEPGAAFYALWTAVAMDLLSRLMSESVQHGGYW